MMDREMDGLIKEMDVLVQNPSNGLVQTVQIVSIKISLYNCI